MSCFVETQTSPGRATHTNELPFAREWRRSSRAGRATPNYYAATDVDRFGVCGHGKALINDEVVSTTSCTPEDLDIGNRERLLCFRDQPNPLRMH